MGLQYLFVAAGATILVPILTGIPVSACLFAAGIGTLIFHVITKGKVPVLLSSLFAFIAPIIAVSEMYGQPYAFGGILVAGVLNETEKMPIVLLTGTIYSDVPQQEEIVFVNNNLAMTQLQLTFAVLPKNTTLG